MATTRSNIPSAWRHGKGPHPPFAPAFQTFVLLDSATRSEPRTWPADVLAHRLPPGERALPHIGELKASGIPDVQRQPRGPANLSGNRRATLDRISGRHPRRPSCLYSRTWAAVRI
ncbi:MAG: hypothetical protein AB9879_09150 [Methanothrix sp.]